MKQMNNLILSIIAAATILRLLLSIVLFPNNSTSDNDTITSALGPGILPALGAAILDPVHTWDHLEEACFWLEDDNNGPLLWTDSWFGGNGNGVDGGNGNENGGSDCEVGGYAAIYTPGTRIVSPPLVVAFLGETLVCPRGYTFFRKVIKNVLLLIADAIGTYCMYHIGKRIYDMECGSNEEDMERHTQKEVKGSGGDSYDELVVPRVLRPQRGWIFGLSSKIIPPEEELLTCGELNGAPTMDDNKEKENNTNGNSSIQTNPTTSPSSLDDEEPIITMDQLPLIAAISYYCNPISMLANATGSIRSVWDALLLLSFYYATLPPTSTTKEGIPIKIPSATKVAFSFAAAMYVDVGYGVFLLPILLWRGMMMGTQSKSQTTTIRRGQHRDWKMVVLLFLFYFGGMHYFASMLVGGSTGTYGKVMIQTMLPNLAFVQQDGSGSVPGPSMGLHWYMFVQVFDRFRPYFTVFVSGISMMFAIPLAIRLYRYPSVLAATFQLLASIFQPTTTVHTLTLALHLTVLNPRTIVRMRDPSLISFFALPVPILLFVTFHRMWLVTGNGNPNYIYFQCFAYGMFVTIISMEFVTATVKRDKVRRMMEKGSVKKILDEMKEKEEADDEDKEVTENGTEEVGAVVDKVDDQNGDTTEEAGEDDNGDDGEESAEDAGSVSDDVEDGAPEPVVVFV